MKAFKTIPFQMRVSREWLSLIDEWRRRESDIPPRAEAIRRLVEKAIGGLSDNHEGSKGASE